MSDFEKDQENMNEITRGDDTQESPKQKRISKWGVSIVSVSFILIGAILFSIFSPSVINTIARVTLSPAKYYQKIEKANLEKQIDVLSEHYGNYIEAYQNSIDNGTSTETSISTALDSTITTNLGLTGLNNIKATILSSSLGLNSKASISFACNDKDITSLDYYLDLDKEDFFIKVPDLNSAYLKTSFTNATMEPAPFRTKDIYEFFDNNSLTEELLNKLLKKYSIMAIEEVHNVIVKNGEKVTADNISSDYTKLTVEIDKKTSLSIADKILKTAKSDDELRDLFVKLKIYTKEEYETLIQDSLNDIAAEEANISDEDIIIMTVWIDNKGNIMGRDFSYTEGKEKNSFGYKSVRNGTDLGIEAWLTTEGIEILSGKGTLKLSLNGASGDVKFSYNDQSYGTPHIFNLSMKDVKSQYRDSIHYLDGTFTITSETLSAINVTTSFSSKEKQQDIVIDVVQGGVNLANISIASKYAPFSSIEMPKETDTVYDADTELNEYLSTARIEEYLKDINEKINIEGINSIIDSILYSYSY